MRSKNKGHLPVKLSVICASLPPRHRRRWDRHHLGLWLGEHTSGSDHTGWEEGPDGISGSEVEDRLGADRAGVPGRCRNSYVAAPPCGPKQGHARAAEAGQTARDRCQ